MMRRMDTTREHLAKSLENAETRDALSKRSALAAVERDDRHVTAKQLERSKGAGPANLRPASFPSSSEISIADIQGKAPRAHRNVREALGGSLTGVPFVTSGVKRHRVENVVLGLDGMNEHPSQVVDCRLPHGQHGVRDLEVMLREQRR